MKSITVHIASQSSSSYDIVIGANLADRVALMIAKDHRAPVTVVVTDENVAPLYGAPLAESLSGTGRKVETVIIPAGESAKNIDTVMTVVRGLLAAGADRTSLVVAVGGGVVGDIVGFAASMFMRGIPYVQIPTTLVAQTDSSVGGKTGVDLPEGKNLIGAFYQPAAVIVDLSALETLPAREYSSGLAEVVKYALLDGEGLLAMLEANVELVVGRDLSVLEEVVERSCRIKQGIVQVDERESGLRRILNLGHTVGHALESATDYRMSHGEGVAIGMVAALHLSELRHGLSKTVRSRAVELLETFGLPTAMPADVDVAEVIARTKSDKKREGDKVNFVLLKDVGMPFVDASVSDSLLAEVLEGMKA